MNPRRDCYFRFALLSSDLLAKCNYQLTEIPQLDLTPTCDFAPRSAQSKTIAWKYIEAQQDSLKTREELSKTRALVDDLNDQISQLRATNNQVKREANLAQAELAATRRAHEEHAKKTREQINRLMKQVRAQTASFRIYYLAMIILPTIEPIHSITQRANLLPILWLNHLGP